MTGSVQIDEDQVREELRAIETEQAPPPPPEASAAPAAPEPAPEQPPDWRFAAAGVVTIFDRVIAPNWQLTGDEKNALHESVTQVLVAFFPHAIDPRIQACMALAGTVFVIAQGRVDPATGKVRPMRVKPKPQPEAAPDAAASRAAA